MKRYFLATASLIASALVLPQPASAVISYAGGLVFDNSIQVSAQGFGNVPRLLTLQGDSTGPNAKSTESGCVSAAGGSFNVGSDSCDGTLFANAGGDEPNPLADNQKYGIPTLAEMGWFTAEDVALVFNSTQPAGGPINVDNITLKFYDGAGLLIAEISGAHNFADSDPGSGSAGFGFDILDPTVLADLNTNVFANADFDTFRIALEAQQSLFAGGTESWASVDRIPGNGGGGDPVPETATWMMMMIGFGGMGAAMRARRASARTTVSYS